MGFLWLDLFGIRGCIVETQWVFWVKVGFLGFSGFKWVYSFSDLSILGFFVYVRVGMKSEKCKIPLILPFLGLYLSFHL